MIHLLALTGNIAALGTKNVPVNRADVVGFSLDLDTPTFEIKVQTDADAQADLDIQPNVIIQFDTEKKAQVGHVFSLDTDTGKIVGYVADAKINDSVARDGFDTKLTSGTFGANFSTAFGLAPTDKVARLGLVGGKMKEIEIEDVQDLNAGNDGLRIVAKDAAYFVGKDDLVAWLKDEAKFKATKVGEFGAVVTTISRPADEDVYYASGPKMSFKAKWNGDFEVVDTKETKFLVIGPVAGKNDTVVMGKVRDTADGQVTELTYKATAQTDLGYERLTG